jgi:YQGE family putative transporter
MELAACPYCFALVVCSIFSFFSRLHAGIKRKATDIFSLDSMSGQYHILAVNYIYLMIYATLESIFVNTLLYRISPDIAIVIVYRGITYVVSAITMHAAAYITRRTGPVLVTRIGGAFYLAMYIALFFGMDHMEGLMYLTAILSGMAGAFYWAGHNTLIPHYTTPQNRDVGVSILCIIQGVATLFVPVISGEVISFTEAVFGAPEIGYRIIFGIGMLTVAAQVRYQRKLPAVEPPLRQSKIRLAVKLFMRKPTFRYCLAYEYLRGFRDGAFAFVLNMVLFELVTSESLVGVNAFLTGVLSILGAWAYGKLVTPRLRVRYTVVATTAMSVFCSLLFVFPSVPVVMLFAVINAFFALFVSNVSSNSTIDVLTENALSRKALGETLSIREGFLALGRISGLGVFFLVPGDMQGKTAAMLALTLSQYLLALLIWLSLKISTRKHGASRTC